MSEEAHHVVLDKKAISYSSQRDSLTKVRKKLWKANIIDRRLLLGKGLQPKLTWI